MHVAFWSPAWPLHKFQNGIITYVHWMKRELESQGHRVSIFTGTLDEEDRSPDVHLVGRSGGLLSRALDKHVRRKSVKYDGVFEFGAEIGRAIASVHRRTPIDVVEMEESFGWFADVARITSLPLVVKLHGPAFLSMVEDELLSPLGLARIEREGQALAKMDVIVAPSALILTQTLNKYGLTTKHPLHIVNPVVMDERTPLWRLSACDANCILFVGRFDLRKGGDVVIKAFAAAAEVNKKLRLVFVGPDSGLSVANGRKIQFSEFCDTVLPAEPRSRVEYRGRMAIHEIMALRTQAMLTIIASRWENQGYALLEAMFQGCPVVSTDAGGCPESIQGGVTGLLAESENADSFARQILAAVSDKARAEALGRAAREHVIKEHAANKVVASALSIYAEVINAHRSRLAG